jgi:hypothetical protein
VLEAVRFLFWDLQLGFLLVWSNIHAICTSQMDNGILRENSMSLWGFCVFRYPMDVDILGENIVSIAYCRVIGTRSRREAISNGCP